MKVKFQINLGSGGYSLIIEPENIAEELALKSFDDRDIVIDLIKWREDDNSRPGDK